jgi:hypothetical protein
MHKDNIVMKKEKYHGAAQNKAILLCQNQTRSGGGMAEDEVEVEDLLDQQQFARYAQMKATQPPGLQPSTANDEQQPSPTAPRHAATTYVQQFVGDIDEKRKGDCFSLVGAIKMAASSQHSHHQVVRTELASLFAMSEDEEGRDLIVGHGGVAPLFELLGSGLHDTETKALAQGSVERIFQNPPARFSEALARQLVAYLSPARTLRQQQTAAAACAFLATASERTSQDLTLAFATDALIAHLDSDDGVLRQNALCNGCPAAAARVLELGAHPRILQILYSCAGQAEKTMALDLLALLPGDASRVPFALSLLLRLQGVS